eukprot:scaffold167361_cov30-Tisochrysis_lutea.AAC.1
MTAVCQSSVALAAFPARIGASPPSPPRAPVVLLPPCSSCGCATGSSSSHPSHGESAVMEIRRGHTDPSIPAHWHTVAHPTTKMSCSGGIPPQL